MCLFLAACAGGGTPRARTAPEHGVPAWEIPQADFGTQRLFRVSYTGPEGEGSFKVTLRLFAMDRYQLQAVDPVGRALWSLDVTGERGSFLNHRNRTACVFEGSFDISGISLGPFPLLTLPSLLLGRVPSRPQGEAETQGREVKFYDASGRLWSAEVGEGGLVQSWTLIEEGKPAIWWLHSEGWNILSDRDRGVQVRWREVLREKLAGPPTPLERPAGYREESCGETPLPTAEPPPPV